MNVKKRFILIIALIALIAFITMPAQASSVTVTVPKGGSVIGASNIDTQWYLLDGRHADEITRITGSWTEICFGYGGYPSSNSFYGQVHYNAYNGAVLANYTCSKTATTVGGGETYENSWTLDCSFTDWADTSAYTGTIVLSLDKDGESYYDKHFELMRGGYYESKSLSEYTSDYHAVGWRSVDSNHILSGTMTVYYTPGEDDIISPEASFTCTPTSQYPDTSVVCTDTSTNSPTDWYWTIDAEAMGINAWQTHTGQNFTWESHYPGFYSVNLRANNSAGSDWENKTNYVSISVNATPNNCDIEPAAGYVRTYAQTNDGMTSGGIYNSNIQMKDVEGSAWSNVTNSGGWWCIDTLPGHTLNLYAQATGYTSVESLGVPANGGRHYLVMWPDYIPTPSAGNVTLYALVYDQQTGAPLYLSSVRVDGNTINTFAKNTGPEGQAMFTIKNDTSIHVTASKSGYSTITKVMTTSHFGPDTIMISLPRTSVTATATATPTPSWMTPVTTLDSRSSSEKDAAMMDKIRNASPDLIDLAILVTFMSLVGLLWKGFGK